MNWTVNDIPDQTGRIALVTGANSGLGWETTLALARKNAHVIMTARNTSKGQAARAEILAQVPNASVEVMALDLADLQNIQAFSNAFKAKFGQLHMLINNAGVMGIPRQETVDGFEMQFGTNHLGHFALTGRLLDVLLATPHSRVVTVSSSASYMGTINFDDLQSEKSYVRYMVYCQSKLANVLFAFELQRRLTAAGSTTTSFAVHPGFAHTNLQSNTYTATGAAWERLSYNIMMPLFSQSAAMGALPQLYAATSPDIQLNQFIGPRFNPFRGYPRPLKAARAAYDPQTAQRLWEVSEQLTQVHYDFAVKQPA